MKDLVSIIIPIYNVEKYLARCIDSTMQQTYKNIEILLVDDGSTDNSSIICDQYAAKDSRIKVFHKKNGGLGDARNYGLNHSIGEYVIFLDSDDYIELNTIEKMIQYSPMYDIVCCGFDRVSENTGRFFSREMIDIPFDEININNSNIMETAFLSPSGWGKLFKRQLLTEKSFSTNKNSIEDILFYLEVIPTVSKIKYLNEVLWHYMVRDNSLIMSINEGKADLFESELLIIKNKYINNNYSKETFNYLILQVFIHNCISIPSRLYNNKDVDIRKRIKHVKKYMDNNFPGWTKIKINVSGRFIKKEILYVLRYMYRTNTFIIFLKLYNFMINKLNIDVKW